MYDRDGKPIIVEFKGILDDVVLERAETLALEPRYMVQMILYSFMARWVDVWFIWGEDVEDPLTLEVNTFVRAKLLPFSTEKPHEEELLAKIHDVYLR